MQVLMAVLDDLWKFARTAVFGVFFEDIRNSVSSYEDRHIPSPQLLLPLHGQVNSETVSLGQNESDISLSPGLAYFVGEPEAALYLDPVIAFDSVVAKLTYGDIVLVIKFGGRWAHVKMGNTEGWILKDMLREQLSDVFPSLVEGQVYEADDVETIKLRLCITDAFNAAVATLPLCDVEYVLYTLYRKNVHISWPTTYGRVGGSWQKILRGKEGIHIGIIPKIGSIMEYVVEDRGHVCYVEAVFKDETIKIRGIGLLDEGMFSVLSMDKEHWKELRPVFIEIV